MNTIGVGCVGHLVRPQGLRWGSHQRTDTLVQTWRHDSPSRGIYRNSVVLKGRDALNIAKIKGQFDQFYRSVSPKPFQARFSFKDKATQAPIHRGVWLFEDHTALKALWPKVFGTQFPASRLANELVVLMMRTVPQSQQDTPFEYTLQYDPLTDVMTVDVEAPSLRWTTKPPNGVTQVVGVGIPKQSQQVAPGVVATLDAQTRLQWAESL